MACDSSATLASSSDDAVSAVFSISVASSATAANERNNKKTVVDTGALKSFDVYLKYFIGNDTEPEYTLPVVEQHY
jgi:flagellar capping protein FliD